MLAIRMQRIGRSGHAQYRVVVQDSRLSPKSGRVVAYLGNYNPHTKIMNLDTEKAQTYLKNGAQPSDRVAGILKQEGLKLPSWVNVSEPKKRQIRHPEKLRRNRPPESTPKAEPPGEETPETQAPATAEDSAAAETSEPDNIEEKSPEETPTDTPSEEAPAETSSEPPADEVPAKETPDESANAAEPSDSTS